MKNKTLILIPALVIALAVSGCVKKETPKPVANNNRPINENIKEINEETANKEKGKFLGKVEFKIVEEEDYRAIVLSKDDREIEIERSCINTKKDEKNIGCYVSYKNLELSPDKQYLIYDVGYWEGGKTKVYDISSEKEVLSLDSASDYYFVKNNKYFYICRNSYGYGEPYALVYNTSTFGQEYKINLEGLPRLECSFDEVNSKLNIKAYNDSPYDGESFGEKIVEVYFLDNNIEEKVIKSNFCAVFIKDTKWYSKSNDCNYYDGKIISDANNETFETLNFDNYAKDKKHAYYQGNIIRPVNGNPGGEGGVDIVSFQVINEDFSMDNYRIYYKDRVCTNDQCKNLPGGVEEVEEEFDRGFFYKGDYYRNGFLTKKIDSNTYKEIGYGYSKDKDSVFYLGKLVDGIDPNTFKVLDQYYARDENNILGRGGSKLSFIDAISFEKLSACWVKDKDSVYYCCSDYSLCEKKDDVDVRTFKVLGYNFYQDKDNVYCGTDLKVMEGALTDSFVVLEGLYAKDKLNIYKQCEILNGNYDVASFQVYSDGRHYWDKDNVYFDGNLIEGADPQTFQVMAYGYKKDKNNVYKGTKKIEGADATTFNTYMNFHNDHFGYDAEDKNYFYKEGEKFKK